MITANIQTFDYSKIHNNKTFLVIGVKNKEKCDLNLFLEKKGITLIKRMPEVCNPNYLGSKEHILQPALVSYKES